MPTVCQTEFADALLAGKSYAPRTFREWIERDLIIPDGPFKDQRFRIERQPAHGVWIDAIDDPHWQDMVFTAVTQFGKSLLAHVCPILYHTCELGQSLTWLLPTADMADTKWVQDFRPVMEASPKLRKLLPTRGSGSRGGKVRDMITLANGAIIKIQSVGVDDSAKGGFTAPILAATEAAGLSKSTASSVEADPLRQGRARQRAYKRSQRRSYIEGTLTVDEELPATLRNESSKSQLLAPCPHCSQYIHPEPEHLLGWQDAKTEIEAIQKSHWVCPKCKRKITERQREKALTKCVLLHDGQSIDSSGKITGRRPESTRLWYHATPFFNLLLEAGDIGSEEWATEQIEPDSPERIAAEKERAQFRWARTYTPPKIDGQIDLNRDDIAARQNQWAQGQVPDELSLLACAIDTGDRRGWYAFLGSLPDGRLIVPSYGSFDIHSDQARPDIAIHAALMGLLPMLESGLAKTSGGVIVPHVVGTDVGHRQDATRRFSKDANRRQKLGQWIMAMRGRGESQIESRQLYNCPKKKTNLVRQIDPDRNWYVEWVKNANVFELHFDADLAKLRVQHGLTLPLDAAGSISLFASTRRGHSRIARHCVNERLIWEILPRIGKKARWHRFGDNHLLDCLSMAYILLTRLGYTPPPLPIITDLEGQPQIQSPDRSNARQSVDPSQPKPTTKSATKTTRTKKQLDKPPRKQIQNTNTTKPQPDDARERVRRWIKGIS